MTAVGATLVLWLGLACMPACTVTSRYMTTVEGPMAIPFDASRATVVFVRPSNWAGSSKVILLDEHARFVGECWGNTYFAVQYPPGHHRFVAWSEGTHALAADLAAGRVYYVELAPGIGWWSQRLHLRALGPGREHWDELAGWLRDATMLVADPSAGQQHVDERVDRASEVVDKGTATYAGYDQAARLERTLGIADGVGAPIR